MKRFTEKEKKILACIHLQAEAPLPQIARETGFKEHVVRHCMDGLRKRGLLQPITVVNNQALGKIVYQCLFSLTSLAPKQYERFINDLIACDQIGWVSSLAGEYTHAMTVYGSSPAEIFAFLESLTAKHGEVFQRKCFFMQVDWIYFGRRHLFPNQKFSAPVRVSAQRPSMALDELDEAILALLANSPSKSRREMAQELMIPLSTLGFRRDRLVENGVISGFVFGFNYSKGPVFPDRILVDCGGVSARSKTIMEDFCDKNLNVTSLSTVLGEWDYELSVEFDEKEALTLMIQNLQATFQGKIISTRSYARFDDRKYVTYPSSAKPQGRKGKQK